MGRDPQTTTLALLAACLVLLGGLAYTYTYCAAAEPASSGGGSWSSNGISESSSGTLFRAVRIRKYTGSRRFEKYVPSRAASGGGRAKGGRHCRNWAVTTTIFPPTKTVQQIAALPDWCLVIAGDKKSPAQFNVSGGAIYLSPADQERMPFATGKLLRWNHFGRKNLGFLYAIAHGAKWVYDTDDDNELQSTLIGIPLPRSNALVDEVATSFKLYNLYPQMSTARAAWPRGFPLESIKDNRTYTARFQRRAWPARRVGVVQSLADHDPDVDGIFRLTQPLPFTFPPATARHAADGPGRRLGAKLTIRPSGAARYGGGLVGGGGGGGSGGKGGGGLSGKGGGGLGGARKLRHPPAPSGTFQLVTLRRGTMMPYNAQATLHAYEALWGLLLPCTVHGRVTDIWRAYYTQRLLWDVGYRIAFSTPWVTQYRNAHNYLADFNSELPLYQQAGALVDALLQWEPTSPTLPGRLEELYIRMYEYGIVGRADVQLAQAWLDDLVALGYRFPTFTLQPAAGA